MKKIEATLTADHRFDSRGRRRQWKAADGALWQWTFGHWTRSEDGILGKPQGADDIHGEFVRSNAADRERLIMSVHGPGGTKFAAAT